MERPPVEEPIHPPPVRRQLGGNNISLLAVEEEKDDDKEKLDETKYSNVDSLNKMDVTATGCNTCN